MFSTITTAVLLALLPLISAQAPVQNCSVKGYDLGKHNAFLILNTTTTAPACKAACASATLYKCSSFAVGGECLLYNVTVNGNVLPVDASPFTFYDSGCVV